MRGICFGLLSILFLAGCTRAELPRGQPVDPPRPVPDLSAQDHRGRVFRLAGQRGAVVVLFFGYSTCPDVCPATLARWKRVQGQLGSDARRVRWVFVTVDPERDTAARVKEYLELFSPDFLGLVGTREELQPLYQFFGIAYENVPQPGSAAGYLVAHTASVPVVDPWGRWRLLLNPDASVDDYVHDLRLLLREAR